MFDNIEAALARGEAIEELIDASADLSFNARVFARTARRHNSCCVVM